MISITQLFELDLPSEKFKTYPELVRWAKKNNLMDKEVHKPKGLKEGEWAIPLKEKSKVKKLNIKTGRLKNQKISKFEITKIPPEERTLKNLPRYANKKPKVRFQDWLCLKKPSDTNYSVGKSPNGEYYGWSHRAMNSFKIGDIIKPGDIGNKYQYGKTFNNNEEYEKAGKFKPYTIKTDEEAKEHAIRFAKDVS
jgi:hypothetical protein